MKKTVHILFENLVKNFDDLLTSLYREISLYEQLTSTKTTDETYAFFLQEVTGQVKGLAESTLLVSSLVRNLVYDNSQDEPYSVVDFINFMDEEVSARLRFIGKKKQSLGLELLTEKLLEGATEQEQRLSISILAKLVRTHEFFVDSINESIFATKLVMEILIGGPVNALLMDYKTVDSLISKKVLFRKGEQITFTLSASDKTQAIDVEKTLKALINSIKQQARDVKRNQNIPSFDFLNIIEVMYLCSFSRTQKRGVAFLSHSGHKIKEELTKIVKPNIGYYFLDILNLPIKETNSQFLIKNICESESFYAFVTENYLKSRFCMMELEAALHLSKLGSTKLHVFLIGNTTIPFKSPSSKTVIVKKFASESLALKHFERNQLTKDKRRWINKKEGVSDLYLSEKFQMNIERFNLNFGKVDGLAYHLKFLTQVLKLESKNEASSHIVTYRKISEKVKKILETKIDGEVFKILDDAANIVNNEILTSERGFNYFDIFNLASIEYIKFCVSSKNSCSIDSMIKNSETFEFFIDSKTRINNLLYLLHHKNTTPELVFYLSFYSLTPSQFDIESYSCVDLSKDELNTSTVEEFIDKTTNGKFSSRVIYLYNPSENFTTYLFLLVAITSISDKILVLVETEEFQSLNKSILGFKLSILPHLKLKSIDQISEIRGAESLFSNQDL